MCTDEEDGVKRGEKGGEDARDDGFPDDALAAADAGDEEVEGEHEGAA